MDHRILPAVGRAVQLHPGWVFLFGFLLPIALAYWFFALLPYRRGRVEDLLSPWHVRRPAVPGVLERYATWEWAHESRLTPFGRWVYQELERQHLSLGGLAKQAGVDVEALLPLLYLDAGHDADSTLIPTLAALLGASVHQANRLLRESRRTEVETN